MAITTDLFPHVGIFSAQFPVLLFSVQMAVQCLMYLVCCKFNLLLLRPLHLPWHLLPFFSLAFVLLVRV